jgi:hypothetical protein
LLTAKDRYYQDTLLKAAAHGGQAEMFKSLLKRNATGPKERISLHEVAATDAVVWLKWW